MKSDNKTVKLYLTGDKINLSQLEKGKTARFGYIIEPSEAELLHIKPSGTEECVFGTNAHPIGMGDAHVFTGFFPRLGIRGTGGFVIGSQKGWFETKLGPSLVEH